MPEDSSTIKSAKEGGSLDDQDLLDGLVAQQTEDHQDPLVGTILGDDYLVLGKIAESEITSEFRAEHQPTNKLVVLKQFKTNDEELLESVQREVTQLTKLKHENIVETIDWFRTPEGQLFCVFEYVKGLSLRNLIEKYGRVKSAEAIARIGEQVLNALVCAKQQKRFHGDLCADSILLKFDNRRVFAKVVFFGLQQETKRSRSLSTSPEELMGRKITYRSNIYSLGGMILEMVTAKPPSTTDEVVEEDHDPYDPYALLNKLEDLADLIRADLQNIDQLKTILAQALERNPDHRYQSIEFFRESFEKWASSVSPAIRLQVASRANNEEGPSNIESSTERRSLFAVGRQDHIFRAAAPEPKKVPQNVAPAAPLVVKEDVPVPTRKEVELKAEQSFDTYIAAEQKKRALVRALVLRLAIFLSIALILSVAVAAVITKILNKW